MTARFHVTFRMLFYSYGKYLFSLSVCFLISSACSTLTLLSYLLISAFSLFSWRYFRRCLLIQKQEHATIVKQSSRLRSKLAAYKWHLGQTIVFFILGIYSSSVVERHKRTVLLLVTTRQTSAQAIPPAPSLPTFSKCAWHTESWMTGAMVTRVNRGECRGK